MTDDRGSVRFDRAAGFYDETRALSPRAARAMTEILVAELRGRRRVLEVGVGTGLVAIPLHEAGVPMAGLDISEPMMAKLVEKAGGRPPFPLVRGDATRLPFRDGSFGAGVVRWVLHLIPGWRTALAELARAIEPGGVLLVHLGARGGPWDEIRERFSQEAAMTLSPVGIDWGADEELDAAMAELGAGARRLRPIRERSSEPLRAYLEDIERNVYSWTWPVPQEVRLRAVEAIRPWVQERYGSLERPYRYVSEIVWRAFDLA